MRSVLLDALHDLAPWLLMAAWFGVLVLGVRLIRGGGNLELLFGSLLVALWTVTFSVAVLLTVLAVRRTR